MPSPVRFAVVVKMLKEKGYYFDHVRGSHHIFKNMFGHAFNVPVHHNQVKYIYVRQIEKIQRPSH
jgi:predicted RNA binding protein YcfA (HicA-like mRNA interferase family)